MNGFSVLFNSEIGKIMKNNKVLAKAVRNSKLYELYFENENEYGQIKKWKILICGIIDLDTLAKVVCKN